MHKDINYIIKRIIIGVGIALILGYLKASFITTVSAKELTSIWDPFQSNTFVFNNTDGLVTVSPKNTGHWGNWGYGNLRFSFSLIKVSGDATSPVVSPQSVTVNNAVCDISSTSVTNSTFTAQTYSATCPCIMDSRGLQDIYIWFPGFQANSITTYRLTMGGLVTFEKVDDVDFSSTNNTINGQTNSINNNINSNTDRIVNSQNQINNTINSTDTTEAQSQASGFFGNFTTNSHGLSGIITAPLSFLQSLTASTCSPLDFTLPFVHDHVYLPCMKPIYEQRFGVFFSLWQLITTGLISYNVCLNFYKKIRDLQNPNNDRIEVLNL